VRPFLAAYDLAAASVAAHAQDGPAKDGTPEEVVAALHSAAVRAINSAVVRDRLTRQGAELVGSSPEEFRRLLERERELWAQVVKRSGATLH